MQATSDNCDSNVSSTSSTASITQVEVQSQIQVQEESTTPTQLLVVDTGTHCNCTAETPPASSTDDPFPHSDVRVHDDLDSKVVADCKTQSSDARNVEGEACVSSQQMDSSSSDENEDDNHSDRPNEYDNASDISELSDFSQESWQPVQGPIAWVQEQMRRGQSPRKILQDLVPSGTVIPDSLGPIVLWKIIINIVSEPPKRKKLNDINTLDDVLHVLNASKKIIVLTGAGVSVSCGIPDFRSRDGVYARLAKDFPNLPDPQAMFDIHFFRHDPRPFFKFAREIYPGQFKPSPCHRFIRLLEEKGKLLRNYTQNIDTLEQVAGIQRVVQCHGSFATATCTVCGHKVDSSAIRDEIFNQVIPRCPRCTPSNQHSVMKPDIVFFGEGLPELFHNQMAADKDECDLLIVIGSSLKVRPVALIPNSLPASVPQILINRERLHYLNFDVELLGNCDEIVGELCRRLGPGWEELAASGPPLSEILMSSLPTPSASPHSSDSVDKWEDASNPAITSSEGTVNQSGNQLEGHTVAGEQPDEAFTSDQTFQHKVTSAQALNTHEDDSDVHEVSTSQSEPSLTKVHKYRRLHSPQNLSLKRPITATDVPAESTVSNLPEVDKASDIFCSPKEMKSLVSACHRKDVVFAPPEKSSLGHHGQHNHQSQEASKSHIHHSIQSSVLELPKSPDHQNSCRSADFQVLLQGHQQCSVTSDSSEGVTIHHETSILQGKTDSQLQVTEQVEQKLPSCSKTSIERDLDNSAVHEEAPESKRPRLSLKECEESSGDVELEGRGGLHVGEAKVCDSQSTGQSLDDVRKLWNNRYRVSLAQLLTDNQVLFLPPSRYIFKGAEVFSGSESDDDSSSDDDDDDSDSDVDKGSDEDRSSVDSDADKVSQVVLESSEKSVTRDLDSFTPEAGHSSHQQKLTSSSLVGVALKKDSCGSPVQNMSNMEVKASTVSGESDIFVQRHERTTTSVIPYPQDKIREGSTQCPVSSSGDVDFEEAGPKSD